MVRFSYSGDRVAHERVLAAEHREVIEPEIGHHFVQLLVSEERPPDARRLHLGARATKSLDDPPGG
jgi:hypothetical protein